MNILLSFTLADGIIVAAVAAVVAAVIYFGFIRKSKKGACRGCPYAKDCGESKEGDKNVRCDAPALSDKKEPRAADTKKRRRGK